MSTRSAFGTISNGTFKGRYIHSDGYPGGVGLELAALIQRDGVDRVLEVVTKEHYGWSCLNSQLPTLTEDVKAGLAGLAHDYGNPARYWAWLQPGETYGDGRFAGVAGYGIAYTTEQNQSSPDEFVTFAIDGSTGDTWGIEWAYGIEKGLTGSELVIVKIGWGETVHKVVGRTPVADLVRGNHAVFERVAAA